MSVILVIGRNGQVGHDLTRSLAGLGEIVSVGRDRIDLADPDSIRVNVRDIRPSLIVNAGAYTAVDKAEHEQALAMAVNGKAPGVLAEEGKRLGAPLIHYSTDYVFDGRSRAPYTEDDATHPLNVYGRSKLEGENAIQAIDFPHLILRTSWVYAPRGANFMLTILRLAKERRELKVVNDQWGAPTSSAFLATNTAMILRKLGFGGENFAESISRVRGIYHLTADGRTTWFGFASAILAKVSQAGKVDERLFIESPAVVKPIPSEEYPLPTPRPKNSLMANEKVRHEFCLSAQHWESVLTDCLAGS